MRKTILARLHQLEAEENISILLAIESGSRAWGFHSPDSDYDVRFIYTRPIDWHLSLGKKRDVVERPIDDELDLSGWELAKALSLALDSNAVVAEWLQSPIVYLADTDAVTKLTDFARMALSQTSVSWHYLSLLRRQSTRVRNPDGSLRLKRYFYMIRPALALRWMRINQQPMPPMDMAALMRGCQLSTDEIHTIDDLTQRKMAVLESHEATASNPMLDQLIADEAAHTELWLKTAPRPDKSAVMARANQLHIDLTLAKP